MRKIFFLNIYYSFPVQLFLLHFKKYQVLLLLWYILYSTISGGFMKNFGASALFFAPEYLGSLNLLGYFIIGVAWGMFMMSWNITTFILHSKRFKFLAATSHPFLKYCINNAVLPVIFLIYYLFKLAQYAAHEELENAGQIALQVATVLSGITLLLMVSFGYFFGTGRRINRNLTAIISNPELFKKTYGNRAMRIDEYGLKVRYYLSASLKLKKVRTVGHYRQDFIDNVFKRHHLSAIAIIILAFVFLAGIGFLLDYRIFELPAGACTLVFFALLIAVVGALSYFMESWSLAFVIVLIIVVNFLFAREIIDPRNKAYGLNYLNKSDRPEYNRASLASYCTPEKQAADKANMIKILNSWKVRQSEAKPLLVFINASGGGIRSAAFTMNSLQQLDSAAGGKLMEKAFLISGASGGMLAATYYRELCRQKINGTSINLADKKYLENISGDLLNPVFTSLMARDLIAPAQKFKVGGYSYVKDRGYAFEKKLIDNTGGLLSTQLEDFRADESAGKVPLIFFNSVINSDARKLVISTQPVSFMMTPPLATGESAPADGIDFAAFFSRQKPLQLRLSTALRMNATFPYVLPNVWLPSNPVIDVMDAGLRDNFGLSTTLRFVENFEPWIKENTSGILILQIKDRASDNWSQPFETKSISDMVVTPATMLQHNWFKIQTYAQQDQYAYFKRGWDLPLHSVEIVYKPADEKKTAALSLHLTAGEKKDVISSLYSTLNNPAIKKVQKLLNPVAAAN